MNKLVVSSGFLFYFIILFSSKEVKCQPNLADLASNGNCTFYNEMEKLKQCGQNGYLISYGGKYCRKFGETSDKFNQDGKDWINGVRKCLMNRLLSKYEPLNCKELAKYAFETHVDCYVEPGYGSKGLCSIWASQNLVGLMTTLELKDFFNSLDAVKQIFATMGKCMAQYGASALQPIVNLHQSLASALFG